MIYHRNDRNSVKRYSTIVKFKFEDSIVFEQ